METDKTHNFMELLKECQSVWDRLKTCEKPVVIYGMGNGADKIMDILERDGVKVSGIIASDGFVRGHSFRGFKVGSISDIEEAYENPVILMSFATNLSAVLGDIRALSERYEVLAPEVPVYGGELSDKDFLRRNAEKIRAVYSRLADAESRREYLNVLNYKISGKITYLPEAESRGFGYGLIEPSGGDVFVDAGAYKGDTVGDFLALCGNSYGKIIALEPDKRNFNKLFSYSEGIGSGKIICLNAAAWDEKARLCFSQSSGRQSSVNNGRKANTEADSIDNILAGGPAAIIKYDVEGSELKALQGSEKTIRAYRPALIISAYHRSADIFELPLKALDFYPGYRLFFRRPNYIPAWDTVFILK